MTMRKTRDNSLHDHLESVSLTVGKVRRVVTEQNDQYVQSMIRQHSKLLVDELKLDAAQQIATVRDDERNLVIAAAGSGKTRTLIARIRYLLERGVPAEKILAVTFTNKATEEMEDRLRHILVAVANREHEGVTISTLHALGKRIVQASTSSPNQRC